MVNVSQTSLLPWPRGYNTSVRVCKMVIRIEKQENTVLKKNTYLFIFDTFFQCLYLFVN